MLIERASPGDLLALAADRSGASQVVGAVLVLDAASVVNLPAVRAAISDRVRAVPRLRQRLVRAPIGCGRPVWVDDSGFDVDHHVLTVRCPPPGDEPALLGVAADIITRRLPRHLPLWSATVVTGLADGATALIVVVHHVLADGIGGLAVLAGLVDGAAAQPSVVFPRRTPARRELLLESLRSRWRALTLLPTHLRRLPAGIAELAPRTPRPSRSSLNRPTGPDRALAVARTDLATVHAAATARGATVNDIVLLAVTGALQSVLGMRGESAERFVLSVPVSARRKANAAELGNEVGVLRVAVPATADRRQRLAAITGTTRNRGRTAPGSSAAVLGPLFRGLAGLGALRWFVNRQHLITTFVTNLRGPATPMTFLGASITAMIPVSTITGNVTVAFAVLSYAGTLVVTVVADPRSCPDSAALVRALQNELDALAPASPAAR